MSDNCDTSECCGKITDEFERICESLTDLKDDLWDDIRPMLDIINGHQGQFIETPAGYLPTLAETTGRINNFGNGFDEWSFFVFRPSANRISVYLPISIIDPTKVSVALNGVRLASPRDYTISGNVCNLTYTLHYRDWIVFKSYGA